MLICIGTLCCLSMAFIFVWFQRLSLSAKVSTSEALGGFNEATVVLNNILCHFDKNDQTNWNMLLFKARD